MTAPLITSLEQAGEGSRELDGLLARHFGWHRVEPRFARNKAGGWIAPEDFLGVNSDGSPRLDGLHGTDIHRDPPRLSQSLDAALALAERVLPGRTTGHLGGWSGKRVAGLIAPDGGSLDLLKSTIGVGNTPALALCIAILKAKAAISKATGDA